MKRVTKVWLPVVLSLVLVSAMLCGCGKNGSLNSGGDVNTEGTSAEAKGTEAIAVGEPEMTADRMQEIEPKPTEQEMMVESEGSRNDVTEDEKGTPVAEETEKNIAKKCFADFNGDGLEDKLVVEIRCEGEQYINIVAVSLNNGLTKDISFLGMTDMREDIISVKTGKLNFADRDSIVIEITNSTSNYGGSDIHVLSVEEKDNEIVLTEELTILDTMEQSLQYDLYKDTFFALKTNIVSMTSEDELIEYVEELRTNAIKVTDYENDGVVYVYWDGSEWKSVEGERR